MKKLCDVVVKYRILFVVDVLTLLSVISVGALRYFDKYNALQIFLAIFIGSVPIARRILEPEIRKRYNELIRENGRLLGLQNNIEKIFEVWLEQILDLMGLNACWRASFYVFDEGVGGNNCFRFVARFSKDPSLMMKGRSRFPADKGVIGKAWQKGSYHAAFIPVEHCKTRAMYNMWMVQEFGYDYIEADKLSMLAKTIMGYVVCDAGGNKKGIVIVESTSGVSMKKQKTMQDKFKMTLKVVSTKLAKLAALNSEYILCEETLQEG